MIESRLDEGVVNILGEILWHSATADASIRDVSEAHTQEVLRLADLYLAETPAAGPIRFLEVAAYAHITGYMLSSQRGWQSTVSDISVETLALGAKHARSNGLATESVRRVAVDFHQLPFANDTFDVVYISSALHHTLRWKTVLAELVRVTAPGGILVMQNEPCQRDFCFYKFPTNRAHDFRPVEKLLDQQGILKTVAEPYPGSRPESLFGMIENQKMPVDQILDSLLAHCAMLSLVIDSESCLSDFDRTLLTAPRQREHIRKLVEQGLLHRVAAAGQAMEPTDLSLGICLPTSAEIGHMADVVSARIVALPPVGTPHYPVAVAAIFGGALTAVVRKHKGLHRAAELGDLLYNSGVRKGVTIGYPFSLTKVLDLAQDLVPDIQVADTQSIQRHFAAEEWLMHGNHDLKYLVLLGPVGRIAVRSAQMEGALIVLLRVYANPVKFPFRLEMIANGTVIASVDVHQQESFLLRGELPRHESEQDLRLQVCHMDGRVIEGSVPVTVPAVRIVCIPEATV